MNMSAIDTLDLAEKAAQLLHLLGQAERLSILLAIGNGEACVCHLEAALGLRQAYISQHLMTLRQAFTEQHPRGEQLPQRPEPAPRPSR